MFGSFLATSLVTVGGLVVTYSMIPLFAWYGLISVCVGFLIYLDVLRERISMHGLKSYLPNIVNDYLTRKDLVDEFVKRLRENGAIPKMFRLMLIKWFDLTREEIVEVLTGIWPKFKELSEEGALLHFTPKWFKRIYSPGVGKECSQPDDSDLSVDVLYTEGPSTRGNYNILPLVLWLAENRVRWAMAEGLPVARRLTVRTMIPAVFIFLLWRKVPRTRTPLSGAFGMILFIYALSITRGLPASFERFFKLIRFAAYRRKGERPYKTNQSNGSLAALMYAFVEPFVPVVNITSHPPIKKESIPKSPALSQASTIDQSVMY
jgi:hypothetical protein